MIIFNVAEEIYREIKKSDVRDIYYKFLYD